MEDHEVEDVDDEGEPPPVGAPLPMLVVLPVVTVDVDEFTTELD